MLRRGTSDGVYSGEVSPLTPPSSFLTRRAPMPGRSNSGYQPLSQSADVEEEDDVGDVLSVPSVRVRRFGRTGKVDLLKLDNAFKRCVAYILLIQLYLTPLQVDRIHSSEGQAQEEGYRLFRQA